MKEIETAALYKVLHEHFFYNKEDGLLYRKNNPLKPAGGISCNGSHVNRYNVRVIVITLNPSVKKRYYSARLIFLMHHGYLPDFIDYVDGNTLNTKIENLSAAQHSQVNQTHKKEKKLYF